MTASGLPIPAISRGNSRLFSSFDLPLKPGKYWLLTGANGSGKTSLLRYLADTETSGLLVPVFWFAHAHGLRYELEVEQQLLLSIAQGSRKDTSNPALLLQHVGLYAQRYLRVSQLSQGQQRRLQLAIMQASTASFWLLDEPLNALDQSAKVLLGELLVQHLQAGGFALVASHSDLQEHIAALTPYNAGSIALSRTGVQVTPVLQVGMPLADGSEQLDISSGVAANFGFSASMRWSLRREWMLLLAKPSDMMWPLLFQIMLLSLFPLVLGSQPELLMRIAPGVCWISMMLATLLASQRLFEADYQCGALAQMQASRCNMAGITLGKIVSQWLAIGLPLAVPGISLCLFYHLPVSQLPALLAALAVGGFSLIGLTALFAALALMARQAQVMINLLALPLFVPMMIFGHAASQSESLLAAPFCVLLSVGVLCGLLVPLVTSQVLRLALE